MLQFYFLSVLTNALAGLCLAAETITGRFPSFAPFKDLLGKASTRTGLGVAALVVGFLKLLVRSTPADVPVAGDLLPAVAGLAMGGALLVGKLRERGAVSEARARSLEDTANRYRVPLGLGGLVVSLLHFLLPGALLL